MKFFTEHVLRKPWAMPNFIRPPKVSRLPDIVSVAEAQALFGATRVLSYRSSSRCTAWACGWARGWR